MSWRHTDASWIKPSLLTERNNSYYANSFWFKSTHVLGRSGCANLGSSFAQTPSNHRVSFRIDVWLPQAEQIAGGKIPHQSYCRLRCYSTSFRSLEKWEERSKFNKGIRRRGRTQMVKYPYCGPSNRGVSRLEKATLCERSWIASKPSAL